LIVDVLSIALERMFAKHLKLASVGEQILYYCVHLVQRNTNKHTQASIRLFVVSLIHRNTWFNHSFRLWCVFRI